MPVIINTPSQKQICAKCCRREGSIYSFHYGKKLSATTRASGNRYIHTSTYHVGGKKDVAVCNWCVCRRWFFLCVIFALGAAAGALFWWWAYLQKNFWGGPGLVFIGIAVLGFIGFLIQTAFAGKTSHAERLIIWLKKDELQRKGFDSFWDTKLYRKLRR